MDENVKVEFITENMSEEPFQHQIFYNIEVETDPLSQSLSHREVDPKESESDGSSIAEDDHWDDMSVSEKLVKKYDPFSSKPDYYMTLVNTTTNQERYCCLSCGAQYRKLKRLIKHKASHLLDPSDPTHTPGEENVGKQCKFCPKVFRTQAQLRSHLNSSHLNHREFRCSLCNKSFAQIGHLKTHQVTHTGEKRYSCDVCNKKFKQSGHLLNHKRVHTDERKFICTICSKGFKQNIHLKSHIKTHTGEKDYLCIICKKSFKQSGHLQMHMRTHTGERKHECTICLMKFKQSGHLQSHLRTHEKNSNKHAVTKSPNSEIRPRDFDNFPFTCPICTMKFKLNRYLQSHLRMHEKTKLDRRKFLRNKQIKPLLIDSESENDDCILNEEFGEEEFEEIEIIYDSLPVENAKNKKNAKTKRKIVPDHSYEIVKQNAKPSVHKVILKRCKKKS